MAAETAERGSAPRGVKISIPEHEPGSRGGPQGLSRLRTESTGKRRKPCPMGRDPDRGMLVLSPGQDQVAPDTGGGRRNEAEEGLIPGNSKDGPLHPSFCEFRGSRVSRFCTANPDRRQAWGSVAPRRAAEDPTLGCVQELTQGHR